MRKYTSLPYTEFPVANGRFDTSRKKIEYIVLHTMVGTMQSTRNLFGNKPALGKETSAHYGVSVEGKYDAYLEEYYTAYHCGNYDINQRSIGIEHEDLGKPFEPRPDALYLASSRLVRDICTHYGIPIDREHIIDHNKVTGAKTACPGSLLTNRIIEMAQQLNQPTPLPPSVDEKDKKIKELEETVTKLQKEKEQVVANSEIECQKRMGELKQKIISFAQTL